MFSYLAEVSQFWLPLLLTEDQTLIFQAVLGKQKMQMRLRILKNFFVEILTNIETSRHYVKHKSTAK